MASELWIVSINDAPAVTLASLGIRNARITRRSFAVDEFSFSMPVADITAAPAFTYGDRVAISYAGVFRFIGNIELVTADTETPLEAVNVTAVNNFRDLEQIIYQQKFVYRTGGDFSGLAMQYSTRVVLGQDPYGRKIRTDQQIAQIMTYALQNGSGVEVFSDIATLVTPPLGEARDISCAAAIMRMAEYTPDAMSRFVYFTGIPTMVIARRASFFVTTINLNAKNLVTGLGSLRARYDLRPNGVSFTFITGVRNEATGELVPVPVVQNAGTVTGKKVVRSTITLALQGSPQAEVVPGGLAADYYASLNYIPWEGQLTLQERECSGTIVPATLINLTNGYTPWSTMYGTVTETVEDIDHGKTTIQLGLPGYLVASDFLDLMTRWRNRKNPTDWAGKIHNGDDGVPPDNGGDGSNGGDGGGNPSAGGATGGMLGQTFPMEVCEDGVTKTKIVSGG